MSQRYPQVLSLCSCRTENGGPTPIGRRTDEFVRLLRSPAPDSVLMARILDREFIDSGRSRKDSDVSAAEFDSERGTFYTRAEALNAMGITRMCCREALLNPTYLDLIDANGGRLTVNSIIDTGDTNREPLAVGMYPGEAIIPRYPNQRPLPELPQ